MHSRYHWKIWKKSSEKTSKPTMNLEGNNCSFADLSFNFS